MSNPCQSNGRPWGSAIGLWLFVREYFFLIREETQNGKYIFQTQSTLGVKCLGLLHRFFYYNLLNIRIAQLLNCYLFYFCRNIENADLCENIDWQDHHFGS